MQTEGFHEALLRQKVVRKEGDGTEQCYFTSNGLRRERSLREDKGRRTETWEMGAVLVGIGTFLIFFFPLKRVDDSQKLLLRVNMEAMLP